MYTVSIENISRKCGVFNHTSKVVCIIDSVDDLALRVVGSYIQAHYDISVYEFRRRFGTLSATTSKKGVVVFIEQTECL